VLLLFAAVDDNDDPTMLPVLYRILHTVCHKTLLNYTQYRLQTHTFVFAIILYYFIDLFSQLYLRDDIVVAVVVVFVVVLVVATEATATATDDGDDEVFLIEIELDRGVVVVVIVVVVFIT